MMTAIEMTADVTGRTSTTYTDGADYYLGQPVAIVTETAGGWDTMVGWYERNGWNGSIEFVASHRSFRPVKTAAAAIKRAAAYINKQSRMAA